MKQKNLILVAVAVGCGLVAAVLTSQMSASPTVPDTQEVPVAAKELPMGTWLKKQDLDTFYVFKKFPKDSLPAAFAANKDDLADKRTARLIRAGEPFNPADLTTNVTLQPPAGFNMTTVAMSAQNAAAGFALPGSRVDVLASVSMPRSLNGGSIVFPLLVDMLVLAVDTQSTATQGGGAMGNVGMVSLAVTNEQATILKMADTRAARLSLVLRNPEKPSPWDYIPTKKEVFGIMADDPKRSFSNTGQEMTVEKSDDKLKLPVPKEDLPAGTQLTDEVLKEKFTFLEFTPPAPANILASTDDLKGQWLTSGLAANQFVPRSYVGGKPHGKTAPALDDAPRVREAVASASRPAPVAEVKDAPVPQDVTIQTGGGITTYRYLKYSNGEVRYVGVVPTGGTSRTEEKKPEGGGATVFGDDDDAPVKKAAPKKRKAADADDAPAKKAEAGK